MKFVLGILSLIVCVGLTSGCATTGSAAGSEPTPSETTSSSLMTFQSTDISGEFFDLADHLGQKTILMNFWATWCGPCRMMAPVIDSVAEKYAGQAKIGKLDVDNNQATAARFQVRGIPMLLVFKDGQVVDQQVGAVPEDKVSDMLDKQISSAS